VDNFQWSPLHFACVRGQLDVAGKLLDAGAKLEARSVTGATPLIEAVRSARPSVVQLLTGRRASTDCTTRNGTVYADTAQLQETNVWIVGGWGEPVWNSVPNNLHNPAVGPDEFRRNLKTHLFACC